jgi:hypothetical protein
MSQRRPNKDLMGQPRQTNDTTQPDSLPVAGASPNAMSPHAPAPAMPDTDAARNLAAAVARRNAAQRAHGLTHGRPVAPEDQGG